MEHAEKYQRRRIRHEASVTPRLCTCLDSRLPASRSCLSVTSLCLLPWRHLQTCARAVRECSSVACISESRCKRLRIPYMHRKSCSLSSPSPSPSHAIVCACHPPVSLLQVGLHASLPSRCNMNAHQHSPPQGRTIARSAACGSPIRLSVAHPDKPVTCDCPVRCASRAAAAPPSCLAVGRPSRWRHALSSPAFIARQGCCTRWSLRRGVSVVAPRRLLCYAAAHLPRCVPHPGVQFPSPFPLPLCPFSNALPLLIASERDRWHALAWRWIPDGRTSLRAVAACLRPPRTWPLCAGDRALSSQ